MPLFGTHTKNTTVIKLRGCHRFVKSRYSIYSSVSDMLDVLGWTPLSQSLKGDRRIDLFCFTKIINGLARVPFEGVLVEAYKGTRRKHKLACIPSA